ncbi:MAG: CmpX protein [Parcubacteria group bacterium GW2011_GWE2_38_18]|nr:MAG: CmpX protein [Parcubacteria group bacterium GW2011_GWE2_38_18]
MNDQTDAITISFINLWNRIIGFIPQLLAAIVVFIIGLIIANVLAGLIKKAVYWLKIDDLFNRIGINKKIKSFGWDFTIADVLAWFVKWFVIFVTLISTADILQLPQISQFFDSVVAYIPRLFVAVVILTLGFIIGEFVSNVIRKTEQMNKITSDSSNLIAMISEWAIIIFSFMAAFVQLGIAVSLLNILFTGIVFMLSLAGGLAFGLGGRESAARILDDLSRKINPKK